MKCFVHPSSDAVGTCKHCCKGACAACARDTGQGLACSEACAGQVAIVASLMNSADAAARINRRGGAYLMPAFLFFMGAVFLGHALLTGRTGQALSFALALGGGFMAFGAALAAIQYLWHKRSIRAGAA